ncbi:MAG: hypothetical protein Q3962_08310 [Corynebacterium sp.]|nr:hypothetical protein [Corynebacterium sp.]
MQLRNFCAAVLASTTLIAGGFALNNPSAAAAEATPSYSVSLSNGYHVATLKNATVAQTDEGVLVTAADGESALLPNLLTFGDGS